MHTLRQRSFPAVAIVTVLLLLCIFPGQSLITSLFPGLPEFVKIRPSLVFLEIPIHLVSIDLILVLGLFLLIYPVVILLFPARTGIPAWRQAMQRVSSVLAGLFVLLFCLLSGGLMYYLVQDYLPRNIRNGIGSFGMNADIFLPYPGYETIHLRGSTVLFVCVVIGMIIAARKIRKEPGMQKAGRLTREQRMTPYERMMQEKRIKEKPMITRAGDRSSQPAVATKPAANRKPAPPAQRTTRPGGNNRPELCCTQPVTTFKPEAVSYMPMS